LSVLDAPPPTALYPLSLTTLFRSEPLLADGLDDTDLLTLLRHRGVGGQVLSHRVVQVTVQVTDSAVAHTVLVARAPRGARRDGHHQSSTSSTVALATSASIAARSMSSERGSALRALQRSNSSSVTSGSSVYSTFAILPPSRVKGPKPQTVDSARTHRWTRSRLLPQSPYRGASPAFGCGPRDPCCRLPGLPARSSGHARRRGPPLGSCKSHRVLR